MKKDLDKYFMKMAIEVSQNSTDPNTKVGCVIVDKNNKVISKG
jgi:deoxycytidylate deaminase